MEGRPNPVTILVCGILGLVLCGLFTAIPAWIMGNNAMNMATSYSESDLSMIKVGRILGIIGTLLGVCGCIGYGLVLGAGGGAASSRGFRTELTTPAPVIRIASPVNA